MKRTMVLGVLIAVGALSLSLTANQPPQQGAQAARPHVVEVEKLKDNLFVLRGRAAAATPPCSSRPTASPSSTRRTRAGARRSSTRSRS